MLQKRSDYSAIFGVPAINVGCQQICPPGLASLSTENNIVSVTIFFHLEQEDSLFLLF